MEEGGQLKEDPSVKSYRALAAAASAGAAVLHLGLASQAQARAVATDTWFSADTTIVPVTATIFNPVTGPGTLQLLYRHWGDGAANPGVDTDLLGGAGTKPPWDPVTGWSGTVSRANTTTHARGSVSTSNWDLEFVNRANPYQPVPPLAAINGTLTAIADKNNLTLLSTDAHTATDWSDPFRFEIAADEDFILTVQHGFATEAGPFDPTGASWSGDFEPDEMIESGLARIYRLFTGAVTDQSGAFGNPFELQKISVGTEEGLFDVRLGAGVTLADSMSAADKKAELLSYLDAPNHEWSLAAGEFVDLGFTLILEATSYDRIFEMTIGGGVFAEEAQAPIPVPAAALLFAPALGGLVLRRRAT